MYAACTLQAVEGVQCGRLSCGAEHQLPCSYSQYGHVGEGRLVQ